MGEWRPGAGDDLGGRLAAGELRDEFARWNAPDTFAAFVEEATA